MCHIRSTNVCFVLGCLWPRVPSIWRSRGLSWLRADTATGPLALPEGARASLLLLAFKPFPLLSSLWVNLFPSSLSYPQVSARSRLYREQSATLPAVTGLRLPVWELRAPSAATWRAAARLLSQSLQGGLCHPWDVNQSCGRSVADARYFLAKSRCWKKALAQPERAESHPASSAPACPAAAVWLVPSASELKRLCHYRRARGSPSPKGFLSCSSGCCARRCLFWWEPWDLALRLLSKGSHPEAQCSGLLG